MSIDDARITAYVLGELSESKRAAFEAELAKDPELQAEVDAVREFTDLLEDELHKEACPRLESEQRQEVLDSLQELKPKRFPKWRVILSSAAALTVGWYVVWSILGTMYKEKETYAVAEKSGAMVSGQGPQQRNKPVMLRKASSSGTENTSERRGRMLRMRQRLASSNGQAPQDQNVHYQRSAVLTDDDLKQEANRKAALNASANEQMREQVLVNKMDGEIGLPQEGADSIGQQLSLKKPELSIVRDKYE